MKFFALAFLLGAATATPDSSFNCQMDPFGKISCAEFNSDSEEITLPSGVKQTGMYNYGKQSNPWRFEQPGSPVTSVKWCNRNGGNWLSYISFCFANGKCQEVGKKTTSCGTVTVKPDDCINEVTVQAAYYVDELHFVTKKGVKGKIGNMGSFDKRRKTFNFGKGQCMRGAYGTSDGQVSRIGFLYGDPLPTTKATVTFTGKTYADC